MAAERDFLFLSLLENAEAAFERKRKSGVGCLLSWLFPTYELRGRKLVEGSGPPSAPKRTDGVGDDSCSGMSVWENVFLFTPRV